VANAVCLTIVAANAIGTLTYRLDVSNNSARASSCSVLWRASSQPASRPAVASPSTHNATDLTSASLGCVGMRGASLRDRTLMRRLPPLKARAERICAEVRALADSYVMPTDGLR
jgi:hypothetical protein